MSGAGGASILVVEEEELMIQLMGEFAPDRNRLFFAVDVDEALQLCEAQRPALVIVRLDVPDLRKIADQVRAGGACVLGLGRGEVGGNADAVADPADSAQVATAARRLVKERRQAPRAALQVPVDVEGVGTLTASRISSRSLFIPSEVNLQLEQTIRLEVTMEGQRTACDARVIRREASDGGEAGVVLILEQADAMAGLLDKLTRQSILLQYLAQPLQTLGGAPKLSIARKIVDYGRQLIEETPTAEYAAVPSFATESEAGLDQPKPIDAQLSEVGQQWSAAGNSPGQAEDPTLDESWEQIADDWEAVAVELGESKAPAPGGERQ